ncbi:MAG: hypothetical protein PHP86_10640 [Nevskiales bacterium]|nr:hypothetical protein [Nevskiales bacterium]
MSRRNLPHAPILRHLGLHLGVLVLIKIGALVLLWQHFVAPQRVHVDTPHMAARLTPDAAAPAQEDAHP